MRFEMVDRDIRLPGRPGDPLPGHCADQEPANEARPGRGRDRVDLAEPDTGLVERPPHQPVEMVEMRPCGDLRHDAAVGRVLVELRLHDIGADLPPLADDGHRGLVARGFDTENGERAHDEGDGMEGGKPQVE